MNTLRFPKIAAAAALAMLILPAHAQKAEWVKFAETDEYVSYYDKAGVKKDADGDMIFRNRDVYHKGQTAIDQNTGKRYDELIIEQAVSCEKKQIANGHEVVKFKGRFVAETDKIWHAWEDIESETTADEIYQILCKQSK